MTPEMIEAYRAQAARTLNDLPKEEALEMIRLGLIGEIGEVCDLYKKQRFHGHEVTQDQYANELGDVCWYAAAALTCSRDGTYRHQASWYGSGFEDVAADAIADSRKIKHAGPCVYDSVGDVASAIFDAVFCMASRLCPSWTMQQILDANIDKLKARYPDGFSEERSRERDDEAAAERGARGES